MNKFFFLLLLNSVALFAVRVEQPHTIFMPRSVSSSMLYTDGFLAPVDAASKRTMSLTHTILYQESCNSRKSAPFFLGDTKTSLLVDEAELGDVNSDWFHIESAEGSSYQSTLSVAPKRSLIGVCLRAHYVLDNLLHGLWASVVLPIVQVTHELRPSEVKKTTSLIDPSSAFQSVLAALDWDNWRAGKWSQEEQSIIGFDDVLAQLGLTLDGPMGSTQQFSLELALPIGHRPTGQYLFEPLIGSQGAIGVGGAIKTLVPLVKLGLVNVSYAGFISYRYYFQAHQPRLFDLKGQPFSRYLVYMDTGLIPHSTNVAIKASNGNNFFLRDSLVRHGATGQSINGLEFVLGNMRLNVGYMHWWRMAEQVSFVAPLDRTFAVPSPLGLSSGGSPVPVWLSGAQITDKFSVDDLSYSTHPSVVQDIEFDIDSGAMPHVASHTLFIDFSGAFTSSLALCTARLGLAYEFAQTPAVLDSVHAWCGIGIMF